MVAASTRPTHCTSMQQGWNKRAMDHCNRVLVLRVCLHGCGDGCWWGEGGSIKVERSMKGSIRGQFRVEATVAEEIHSKFALWEKTVPFLSWVIQICNAQRCDNMCFEGLNGSFGCITAINMRWNELVGDLVLGKRMF